MKLICFNIKYFMFTESTHCIGDISAIAAEHEPQKIKFTAFHHHRCDNLENLETDETYQCRQQYC
jgi:hypothetical protein